MVVFMESPVGGRVSSTCSHLMRLVALTIFATLITLVPKSSYAQSSQTAGELLSVLKDVPGLSDLPVSDIRLNGTSKSAKITLRGKTARVAGFKIGGVSMGAFMPDNFNLTDVVPIPHGTPIDGISFKDIVFILVPKGKAKTNIAVSSFPSNIRKALSHAGSHINLKAGLNLFGEADFASAGAVKKVLQTIGHNQFSIPLSGAFPANLLGHDLKTATKKIKSDLITGLNLTLPLPKNLRIPGMPSMVSIKSSQIIIVGREIKGIPKIFAGITGDIGVKVHNSEKTFSIGMLAAQPGKAFKAEITGDSKDKLSVNLIETMSLTNMSFVANKSAGKWTSHINADTAVNKNKIKLNLILGPGKEYSAQVLTKGLTIKKLINIPDLPGLDDVELDMVEMYPGRLWLQGMVKGVKAFMEIQKASSGKGHFIAAYFSSLSPAHVIPDAANTPLKDVDFSNLVALYSPAKQASTLASLKLSGNAPQWIKKSNSNPTIKPGMNIFGHMDIHPGGKMETLLKKVGVTDLKLPLNGGFSPKAFSKNTGAVKNTILDALDIDIKLPKLKIPEVDKFLAFNNGNLKVKGKTPDGKRGIDIAVSGDADVHVKGDTVTFHVDIDHSKSELTFKGNTTKKWTHPLGIKFLDLDSLTLDIDKKNGSYDINMDAKTDIGSHSRLDVTVDVHEKNGKITNAFFELDGPLKLSEIPGVKDIPHSSHFTIDTIKASEHGIEAKTSFGDKKDLDIFLFDKSGWNLIVRQDNFAITEFVPPLNNTPLKHIVLSEAAIVLSQPGLQGPLSSFSPIAQDALKDIYGKGAANIDIESGLGLIAAFEQKNSKGGLAGALKRLGLSEERVIMTGDIGGLFGGATKLNVDVDLSAHTGAQKQPKWMKKNPGVKAVFSMIATESAGQFDIEIGIGADITAKVDGTELDFTAKTALEFQDEKIDVKIVADLKDKKGWHEPFGIPGFTLLEVGMDLGIDEDGALHLGFDGNIKVSGEDYKIAADADLEGPVPTDIAFIGSADKVDMFFMEAIAIDMVGGDFKIDLPAGILPTFTKVKFAFVTPGAQDPDLHITGEGFAMAGAMNWLDHEVGSMNVAVGPKSGINAAGKIDPLNLGPLHLKNNDFKMVMGPKAVPSLTVDADVEILGITDKFHFDFNKNGIDLAATSDFGDLFKFNITADVGGKNLTKASGIKNADIFLDASLKSDPGKWLRNFGSQTVKKKFAAFDGFAVKAQDDLNKAKAKVDGLQKQIDNMRAKVKAEKKAAVAKLNAQQAKVNNLQNQINGVNGRINRYQSDKRSCNQETRICDSWTFRRGSCAHHVWGHCIWYRYSLSCSGHINVPNIPARIVCEARNLELDVEIGAADVEKAGIAAAKATADEVLKGIAAGIEIVPTDLDPRVAGLILLKNGADLALEATKEALKGVLAFAKVLEKGTNVFKDVPSFFVLNNSSIRGDLKKALKGQPVVLDMDATIMGKTLEQRLAFSLTKPEFDAEQFGMIALGIAMDTVVKAAEDIKVVPAFMINEVEKFYTDEKKRIDKIINAAVAANGITGKPSVDQTAQAIAAMKAKRAIEAEAAGKANQADLAEAEAKHKADYDKFCSVSGNNPHTMRPVFDPCFYLNHNPDLAQAFGADFNKAAQHWLSNGISEGRMSAPGFSTLAYVTRYPDLENAFATAKGKINFEAAVNHWISDGSKEGRNPKPLVCADTGGGKGVGNVLFDPCFYVNKYPDLKSAIGHDFQQAYNHWINHGAKQGRQSSASFAVTDYIIRYPDLQTAFAGGSTIDYIAALGHWHNDGKKEGRNSKPFAACKATGGIAELTGRIFDPCFYVNKYPDLKKSFDYNNGRALSHWVGAGLKNGRQSSASFDINAYVVRYPDLENAFINTTNGAVSYDAAMGHWKKDGKREGRNPKPFVTCGTTGGIAELAKAEFDPCYYLNYYPDLKQKLDGRQELATQHFYQQGRIEGNRSSAGFGISSYILRYPDLTKAFISPKTANFKAAWGHWKRDGKKEGRNPAPLGTCGTTGGIASLAKAEFDPCFYLNAYADLKTAFGKNWGKAAQHWQQYGVFEGRRSSAGFSIRGYLMRYDDLRKAYVNVKTGTVDYGSVMNHWKNDGKREGRTPVPLNCTATGGAPGLEKNNFDPCFYLNNYTDLKKAFDGEWVKAAQHWIQHGINEGRQASADISMPSYIMRYDDLRKAFVNVNSGLVNYGAALGHWNKDGKREGRNPAPFNCSASGGTPGLENNVFDPCFYLNKYPDLKKSFGGNWAKADLHWLKSGVNEGRQSSVGFSIKAYLERYPDLQRAFGPTNYKAALNHWYTDGKKGGRNPKPLTAAEVAKIAFETLSPVDYLIRYEDLQWVFIKNKIVDYNAAANHWKTDGKKEGRIPHAFTGCAGIQGIPELRSDHVFDPCFYSAKYPDLKRAFGNDHRKLLDHWYRTGLYEGRQSAVGFSIKAYLARYPDLRKAFGTNYAAAYNHWHNDGRKEGRNPRP